MKKWSILLIITMLTISCDMKIENPLLQKWDTPFQTPPFDLIKNEHFVPAFHKAMEVTKAEVKVIANNEASPTFKNTIEALEKSSELLDRVSSVFGCLNGANTNAELQSISAEIEPLKAKHFDDIHLDQKLFSKINWLYQEKTNLNLSPEETTLLDNYYLRFVRRGAKLDDGDKEKLRHINQELSDLYVMFDRNHLQQSNAIGLLIENRADLVGLPAEVVQAAAELASARGLEGKWAFSLQRPSFTPFLVNSEKRDLRETLYKAYINRCNNNDDYDNKKIISRIASLRVTKAKLLGYQNHAEYTLERNMAKTPETVYRFLEDLWEPALKRSRIELADMQRMAESEGHSFKIQGWDWWYYSAKVKKEKHDLFDALLRPYFQMESARAGAFEVAQKLYGIQFIKRDDIQVYHPDVDVFEVLEADGTHLGIFYSDYFPRDGKGRGAWSSSFRDQSNIDGNFITPLVYNVGNFAMPIGDEPSLMTLGQVTTLFHELGHALNSLFENTTYSGSRRVPRDFVELPSQIMENWATDPSVLKTYAKHYITGESIPQELIDKIVKAQQFNQGFRQVEYLAASFLDLDWHMLTVESEQDANEFEKRSMDKIGLIAEIAPRYQSPNFGHIFGGPGYSSGYYSYIWAAVLDADAFQAFKETDLFNRDLAESFRQNVLSQGGNDMLAQYVKFRGREPKIEALINRLGLE
ncbi:MAG: M3 family metallopeptidase [Candidatus Marinimicrobia bacterium]|nr:M3 family metallopeptidase [Candidatus Neomarinimicrobiota bacterium]